jgi:hypothetical protein
MKNLFSWAALLSLSVFAAPGQEPEPAGRLSAAALRSVTVVFAPDYAGRSAEAREDAKPGASRGAALRSLETPPSRILSLMTSGRISKRAAGEFSAPGGLIGIRTGAGSVMASTVIVGEDGKPQFGCERLPQALDRLKAAASARKGAGQETGREK